MFDVTLTLTQSDHNKTNNDDSHIHATTKKGSQIHATSIVCRKIQIHTKTIRRSAGSKKTPPTIDSYCCARYTPIPGYQSHKINCCTPRPTVCCKTRMSIPRGMIFRLFSPKREGHKQPRQRRHGNVWSRLVHNHRLLIVCAALSPLERKSAWKLVRGCILFCALGTIAAAAVILQKKQNPTDDDEHGD